MHSIPSFFFCIPLSSLSLPLGLCLSLASARCSRECAVSRSAVGIYMARSEREREGETGRHTGRERVLNLIHPISLGSGDWSGWFIEAVITPLFLFLSLSFILLPPFLFIFLQHRCVCVCVCEMSCHVLGDKNEKFIHVILDCLLNMAPLCLL